MKKIARTKKRIILVVILILMVTASGYLYLRHNKSKQSQQAIIKQVSKHIILPTGEEPTIAKVEDINKLTDPYLKKEALNGDQILLYYTTQKVYLYRPKLHKLVGVYPLILDPSRAQAVGARVLIRIGNGKAEIAEALKGKITSTYPSLKLQSIVPAVRQDYPNTIVIDLTDGSKYDLVTSIITSTGASRGVLPNGEPRPDGVDILIITGLQ